MGYTQSAPAAKYLRARTSPSSFDALKVHVDAGVDDRVDAARTRRALDLGNALRLAVGVHESARTVVRVVQVGAAGPGVDQAIDECLRRQSVAVLEVGSHRQRHGVRDPAQCGERHVRRQMAVVLIAVHRRERRAGGGDGGHAGRLDHARARRVPHVEQEQWIAGHVQLAQLPGIGGNVMNDGVSGAHDAATSSTIA
jgi:hypothetical protein